MSPEQEYVATKYLEYKDPTKTALALKMPTDKVVSILRKPDVRKFLDTQYMDSGYINKHTLQGVLTKAIDQKLEDANESGVYSNKDLADLLKMAHEIRMAEEKLALEKIKAETNLELARQRMSLTEKLSIDKIRAADSRLHAKLEHEKKIKEKEQSAYANLLERLLGEVPTAERVIDAEDGEYS